MESFIASITVPKSTTCTNSFPPELENRENILDEYSQEHKLQYDSGYYPDFSDISDESYSFWNISFNDNLENRNNNIDTFETSEEELVEFPRVRTTTKKYSSALSKKPQFTAMNSQFEIQDSSEKTGLPTISEAFALPSYSEWFDAEEHCPIEPLPQPPTAEINEELQPAQVIQRYFDSGISAQQNDGVGYLQAHKDIATDIRPSGVHNLVMHENGDEQVLVHLSDHQEVDVGENPISGHKQIELNLHNISIPRTITLDAKKKRNYKKRRLETCQFRDFENEGESDVHAVEPNATNLPPLPYAKEAKDIIGKCFELAMQEPEPVSSVSIVAMPEVPSNENSSAVSETFQQWLLLPLAITPLIQPASSTASVSGIASDKPQISRVACYKPIQPNGSVTPTVTSVICKKPGTTQQRQKTVRELLREKKEKKRLENITQEWLMSLKSKESTNSDESKKSDCPEAASTSLTTTATATKKPAILVLNPIDKRPLDRVLTDETQKQTCNKEITGIYLDDVFLQTTLTTPEVELEETNEKILLESSENGDFLPPFRTGRVNAREYRPRHFDMLQLKIGLFQVKETEDASQSKFKVLFTKREFFYDFPVSSICNGGSNDLIQSNVSRVARVIVPFGIVTAMKCYDMDVDIQVSSQPRILIGNRQLKTGSKVNIFSPQIPHDISAGELGKSCVHKIKLKLHQADKLKAHLCNFDERFELLTTISIDEVITPNILPSVPESPVEFFDFTSKSKVTVKKVKKISINKSCPPAKKVDTEISSIVPQVCSCRTSCRSQRCSCVKAARKCNSVRSLCICLNCNNPLNIIESFGIDPGLAVIDKCLFQNIYQIRQLKNYLCQEIELPCCSNTAAVKDCIPGTVLCPNNDCMQPVQYSWCHEIVCSANRNPRNHCGRCSKCCFSIGRHCEGCNSCYFNRLSSPLCPKCDDFNWVVSESQPICKSIAQQTDDQRNLNSDECDSPTKSCDEVDIQIKFL